jgi:hypothetical protein
MDALAERLSRRETIMLLIGIVVLVQVKHLPREWWWLGGILVILGAEVLARINGRQTRPPGRVALFCRSRGGCRWLGGPVPLNDRRAHSHQEVGLLHMGNG